MDDERRPSLDLLSEPRPGTDGAPAPPVEVVAAAGWRPARLDRRASAAAALTAVVRVQVATVVGAEAGVLAGDPDAVHRMRVACRRLRSILAAYRPLWRDGAGRDLDDELRWLAGELGRLRDTQVLRARVAADVDGVPDDQVLGPVRARLERAFGAEAGAAQRALADGLGGDRYRAARRRLVEFATDPPLRPRAGRRAATALGPCVGRDLRRLRRKVVAADASAPAARDAAVHEARKAAKRLRYAAEAAVPVVGKPAARTAARAERLQEALGERQDATLAMALLRREGAVAGTTPGENGFTFGLLYGAEQRRREEAEAAFARARRKLDRPTTRRWTRPG